MAKTKTSFKKGQSGNPKGRPKREWTWSGLLEQVAEEVIVDKKGNEHQKKKLIAESLFREASKGNVLAIKELMNRMDGMPPQTNILAGDEESPVFMQVDSFLNKVYGQTKSESDSEMSSDS